MKDETERIFLLDTNVLSPEKIVEHDVLHGATLLTTSTSTQELLGMQRPGRETGYLYALPSMDALARRMREDMSPEDFTRWALNHAKRQPVSRQADRLDVPRTLLRNESHELGHTAIAIAHGNGQDRLFRAYASSALRGKKLRRVMDKWEFLRCSVEAVIPLDDEIVAFAVSLTNRFMISGHRVKGTTRNTINDMFVAATSFIEGLPLVTNDVQLKNFYHEHGWAVKEQEEVFVATPMPQAVAGSTDGGQKPRRSRYRNRPQNLRSHFSQRPYSKP